MNLLGEDTTASILAGDFNSTPGSAVMDTLARRFRILDKGDDRFTFPSTGPEREIDFVLVRPAARFDVLEHMPIDESIASDHRPLVATVVLRGAGL